MVFSTATHVQVELFFKGIRGSGDWIEGFHKVTKKQLFIQDGNGWHSKSIVPEVPCLGPLVPHTSFLMSGKVLNT